VIVNNFNKRVYQMFAAFFKTSPAETKSQTMIDSETALHDRMVKMLRNQANLAWTTPREEMPSRTGVKKTILIRQAIEMTH
jgi:hypothetical protein